MFSSLLRVRTYNHTIYLYLILSEIQYVVLASPVRAAVRRQVGRAGT